MSDSDKIPSALSDAMAEIKRLRGRLDAVQAVRDEWVRSIGTTSWSSQIDHALSGSTEPPIDPGCCWKCFTDSGTTRAAFMMLCGTCGNKRCPRASDHSLDCSGSNESGQPGSVYAARPVVAGGARGDAS